MLLLPTTNKRLFTDIIKKISHFLDFLNISHLFFIYLINSTHILFYQSILMNSLNSEFTLYSMLTMRYQAPVVQLEIILKDYFPHMNKQSANKRASRQDLPFPVFKADSSQKSPYLVDLQLFAIYLYNQSQISAKDWSNLHE